MSRLYTLLTLLFCATSTVFATEENHLLATTYAASELQERLVLNQEWVTYPDYSDRMGWDTLLLPIQKERLIKAGEEALKHVWKADLATDYLAYKREGSILTGRGNMLALQALTFAELAEGKGRFMDEIINGTWLLCETTWVHAAHTHFQKDKSGLPDTEEPTVELVVADIGAQLAWTHYFFSEEFDKVSALINKSIKREVHRRFLEPYMARDDYWWMGFSGKLVNNWNVWINYNVLQAAMLLEPDEEKLAKVVDKTIRSVDYFIATYHPDGACEEGPSYWGHAGANLYKYLELLHQVVRSEVNPFATEKIQNIGKFIYRAHINQDYYVNFCDASPKVGIKSSIVYQYGKSMGDKAMMAFAADYGRRSEIEKQSPKGCFASALDEILLAGEIITYTGKQPAIGSYFFENTGYCIAREYKEAYNKGFFFSAMGAHNGQPHNHNDVGTFVLYYNGLPVLVDVGVGTYVKDTFSDKRYTIWTMQSGYHNLPSINGYDQLFGEQYAAKGVKYSNRTKKSTFQCDIAAAYPAEAKVAEWVRSYTLNRGGNFVISDSWRLEEFITPSILNFMTVCHAELKDDCILLQSEGVSLQLKFNPKQVKATLENIPLTDSTLKRNWGQDSITRIRLELQSNSLENEHIITVERP